MAGLRALLKTPFTADVWRELAHMRRDGALTPGNALRRLLAFAQRGLKMHYWTERLHARRGGGAHHPVSLLDEL